MKLLLSVLLVGFAAAIPQGFGSGGGGDVYPTDCGHYDFDCVPYFQCTDGYVNTDGAGLIDLRTKPRGRCQHKDPEYSDVIAVCCKKQQHYKDPVDLCPGNQACLQQSSCDKNVNTDGAGLIDLRRQTTTCWSDAGSIGVCCPPPTLDICPVDSICVQKSECTDGQAYDLDNQFQPYSTSHYAPWYSCVDSYGDLGVCCIQPKYECPYGSTCLEDFNCFTEALDTSGPNGWYDVTLQKDWQRCDLSGYSNGGVCCSDVVTCPGNTECVDSSRCVTNAWDKGQNSFTPFQSGGRNYATCFYGSQFTGVCCEAPYLIETCPGSDTGCVPTPEECFDGQLMDYSEVYNPISSYSNDYSGAAGCLIGRGYEVTKGYCCEPKKDIVDIFPHPTQCGIRNVKNNQVDSYIQSYNSIDTRITKVKYYGEAGTNDTYFGEIPWQAIVFDKDYTYIAGGILISDYVILTTAHNIIDKKTKTFYKPSELKIRLGDWQVDQFNEPLPYSDHSVFRVTTHPDFNSRNVHNDIAIIELNDNISPFQYHINPICLPPPLDQNLYGLGQAEYFPKPNTKCIITGWGKDNFNGQYQPTLKRVQVPYVDQLTCQGLLRKTRLGQAFILDDSFVCAGGEESKDACDGDGGGPLACEIEPYTDKYELIGIISWGIGCGTANVPGVYVNVAKFVPWINSNIGQGSNVPTYG